MQNVSVLNARRDDVFSDPSERLLSVCWGCGDLSEHSPAARDLASVAGPSRGLDGPPDLRTRGPSRWDLGQAGRAASVRIVEFSRVVLCRAVAPRIKTRAPPRSAACCHHLMVSGRGGSTGSGVVSQVEERDVLGNIGVGF